MLEASHAPGPPEASSKTSPRRGRLGGSVASHPHVRHAIFPETPEQVWVAVARPGGEVRDKKASLCNPIHLPNLTPDQRAGLMGSPGGPQTQAPSPTPATLAFPPCRTIQALVLHILVGNAVRCALEDINFVNAS